MKKQETWIIYNWYSLLKKKRLLSESALILTKIMILLYKSEMFRFFFLAHDAPGKVNTYTFASSRIYNCPEASLY